MVGGEAGKGRTEKNVDADVKIARINYFVHFVGLI